MSGLLFRLARADLRQSVRNLLLVVVILFIGLSGPLFTSAVRSSIDSYLDVSARKLSAGDLAVGLPREFEKKEVDWLRTETRAEMMVNEVEFVTMAQAASRATLVEVRGVDTEFPIYGAFKRPDGSEVENASGLNDSLERDAWVYPEVLTQLGLKGGQEIRIGSVSFRIRTTIAEAPGATRMGGFAPRVYIARRFVSETKLTEFGSQVTYRIYLKLPSERFSNAERVASLVNRIKETLTDPELSVRVPEDATRGFERFFKFFNLYLVAVSMLIAALSWVGAFYILQVFLLSRLKTSAILMVNGASRLSAATVATLEVVALMVLAFLAAGSLVAGLVELANLAFRDVFPSGFVLRLGLKDLAILSVFALLSGIAFMIPFYFRLGVLKIQDLLGETVMGSGRMSRLKNAASFLPVVGLFLILGQWLSESWLRSMQIAGGIIMVSLLGLALGRIVFKIFHGAVKGKAGRLRLVTVSLARGRLGVQLCFLTLVVVALSLNLVPHLLNSVVREIEPLKGREIPALFLFNIPESNAREVELFAVSNKMDLRYLSPMVQARLLSVNGIPTENAQFQKFPVRLSYRDTPHPSERVISGRGFSGRFDPASQSVAEISLEKSFADRNSLRLGDVIEFDIQGLPIQGQVINLRHVEWSSFHPNFFIIFQPGVLEDAPKTYIANVNVDDDPDAKIRAQYLLAERFPDVSVIDIGRTVRRVLEIAKAVMGPVTATAWAAVIMSFLVLAGIVTHNLKLREAELDIEKVLGANTSLIRQLISSEYLLAAIFAWIVGGGGALVLGWFVAAVFLEVPYRPAWLAIVMSMLVCIGLTYLIAWISASRVLESGRAQQKM